MSMGTGEQEQLIKFYENLVMYSALLGAILGFISGVWLGVDAWGSVVGGAMLGIILAVVGAALFGFVAALSPVILLFGVIFAFALAIAYLFAHL